MDLDNRAMTSVIETRGVGHDFGSICGVKQIQFYAKKGQCIGIVGAPGSGKTTLLQLISGLLQPTLGEIFVLGFNTKTNAQEIRKKVGVMPENHGLDSQLSILDNLMIYGSYFDLTPSQLISTAKHLLRMVQLDENEDEWITDLHPSQCQRLSLARSLIHNPEILLLDQPTQGLSNMDQDWIWRLIKTQTAKNKTILIVSNDLSKLEILCDHILILNKGQIVCQGQPSDLIQRYVGKKVVEYHVPVHDRDYYLKSMDPQYQFQILTDRLKIFIPDFVDTVTAFRWMPSEHILYREANLHDVYTKIMGTEIELSA